MLESDYIFMHKLLGTGDEGRMQRAVNEILRHQNEDGGWSIYPNGPSNISLGVKAYFALKLMGWSKDHPVLVKARKWILANGGVVEVNTFTKIYLCFMGQYEYDAVPAVPPELILFPNWFYFNIYEISAWSRAIVVPLSIAYAKKPFKKIAPEQGIDELFVGGRANANLHLRWDKKRLFGWRNELTGWSGCIFVRCGRCRSGARKSGCWSGSRCRTGWARFIRR
jgi:squalene-hopene/tetraprenyl-beta-curcumene cyclase